MAGGVYGEMYTYDGMIPYLKFNILGDYNFDGGLVL